MHIKRANLYSAEAQNTLSALQLICLPYDKPFSTNAGYWWIARNQDNVPVGFAGLVPSTRWSDCGYLCRAGVIPDCRGKGLQKRLIRVRIQQAKVNGWRWLVTDTYHNPASSNSLISQGFKLYEPSDPWGATGTLYWRLKLKE